MNAANLAGRIDHVMVPVADIERAIAFYEEAFGMKPVERREDERRRIAHVGYGPRAEQATVELVQTFGATSQAGGGHFCIRMPQLAAWLEKWQAAGRPFARPHGMRADRVARAWVHDPDGHLVELADAET